MTQSADPPGTEQPWFLEPERDPGRDELPLCINSSIHCSGHHFISGRAHVGMRTCMKICDWLRTVLISVLMELHQTSARGTSLEQCTATSRTCSSGLFLPLFTTRTPVSSRRKLQISVVPRRLLNKGPFFLLINITQHLLRSFSSRSQ